MIRCPYCNREHIVAVSEKTGCCPQERAMRGYGDTPTALRFHLSILAQRVQKLEELVKELTPKGRTNEF